MRRVIRASLLLAAAVAWFVTAPAAVWGDSWRHHEPVVVAVIVFAVVLGPVLWRERPYLLLAKDNQRLVDLAVLHGTPVGDVGLDAMALDRLQRAAIGGGANRVGGSIVAVAFVAIPVIAAVRVSPWFLLALPFTASFTVEAIRQFRREDPRVRLMRFLAAEGSR